MLPHIRPLPLIKCIGIFYVERCAAHYSFDIDIRVLIEQLAGPLMFVGTNEPSMIVPILGHIQVNSI